MRRPPLPPPLLWQSYLAFWILGLLGAAWLQPAIFCSLLLPLADSRLRRSGHLALAACIFTAGLVLAERQFAAVTPTDSLLADVEKSRNPRLCGLVRDVQPLPDNRLRVFLEDARFSGHPEAEAAEVPGLIAWTWENPLLTPLPGQQVCLNRRPRNVHGLSNEGLEHFGVWWRAHGVSLQVWSKAGQGEPRVSGQGNALARLREELRDNFQAALRPEQLRDKADMPQGAAILAALIFDDRRYLQQRTSSNFAAATLAHSLALSGQHLAVTGLAGLFCVLAAARWRPGIYLRRPRRVWAVLAACPPALVYLWLGNAPPPLVRAGCMLFVLAFWLARLKAVTTLDILCAAVLCITVANPLSVFDTGLRLSVLCVAAIGLGMPFLRSLLPRRSEAAESAGRRLSRYFLQILLLSLMIQTLLLPLNMLFFDNPGFWFLLNVLWLPPLELIVLPGTALALGMQALGLEQAARATLELMALPPQFLADMLGWMNNLHLFDFPAFIRPHWTALPAFVALACSAALTVGREKPSGAGRRLLALACLLLCAGPLLRAMERASDSVRLTLLDVGQGQAVLLGMSQGPCVLLDGGGSNSPRFDVGQAVVAPALSYNAAPRLAAVINSHPDTDHLGGLLYVLKSFEVNAVFDNGREAKGSLGRAWRDFAAVRRRLGAGDCLVLGSPELGLRLEVLWPPRQAADLDGGPGDGGANDASLVLRLSHFDRGLAIIPGDCGPAALKSLLAQGRDLRAKVLVAPHHGSDKSFQPDFYKAVNPELVLASCGYQNSFGHPGAKLRAWLEQQGIPLLSTAEAGQIRLWFTPDGQLRTSRAGLALKQFSF